MTAATPARLDRLLSTTKTLLAILVPLAAISAPILTGAYYLALASGSGTAAREMMMLSDPVSTALALTVVFFPALAAAIGCGAVVVTRGRFHIASAATFAFLATVLSGLNINRYLWAALGLVTAINVLLAWLVPSEYLTQLARYAFNRDAGREFTGRAARWVAQRPRIDRTVGVGAFVSFAVSCVSTVALVVSLAASQLLSPPTYELTFKPGSESTPVVWFSISSTGTWYLTLDSHRPGDPDAVLGKRDLEWAPQSPTAIVTCGLSATACDSNGD